MSDSQQDRRNFHRVVFRRPVQLDCEHGVQSAQLLDISLKGALLQAPDWHPASGAEGRAQVDLGDGEPVLIDMQVQVAHVRDDQVGVKIVSLDVDSATTLRRLVELNLGDPQLLERELEHLVPGD